MSTCRFCGCSDPHLVSVIHRINSDSSSYEEWYCRNCKKNWTERPFVSRRTAPSTLREVLREKSKGLKNLELQVCKDYILLGLTEIKKLKPGTVFSHKTLGKFIVCHSAETNEMYIAFKNELMKHILIKDVLKSKDRYPFDTAVRILNKV